MNCSRCKLSMTRKRIVRGTGHLPSSYLVIGDCIDRAEESLGTPFLGDRKLILHAMLERAGISPSDCYFTHLLLCRPLGRPEDKCMIACSQNIMDIYEQCKCSKVILIGKDTFEFYGKTFPDVVYVYNLDFILKNGGIDGMYFLMAVNKLKEIKIAEEETTKKDRDFKSIGFRS